MIDKLANQAHHLDELACWYHQQFSHLTGQLTLEQRKTRLKEHLLGNTLPVSFVAVNNKQLQGGLCLVKHDIASHDYYSPWLSRIYVAPTARGNAIATRLIHRALHYVHSLGFEQLYLLTQYKQDFFARHGFTEIEKTSLNTYPVHIMAADLGNVDLDSNRL